MCRIDPRGAVDESRTAKAAAMGAALQNFNEESIFESGFGGEDGGKGGDLVKAFQVLHLDPEGGPGRMKGGDIGAGQGLLQGL